MKAWMLIIAGYAIIVAWVVFLVITVVYVLQNPKLTSAELFIAYAPSLGFLLVATLIYAKMDD